MGEHWNMYLKFGLVKKEREDRQVCLGLVLSHVHYLPLSHYYFLSRISFLAYRIRISEILSWDRKSYLTHAILPRTLSNVIIREIAS